MQDHFGGGIVKIGINGQWHFYNSVDGRRYDFTIEQFATPPEYFDLPCNREEAFADTSVKNMNIFRGSSIKC